MNLKRFKKSLSLLLAMVIVLSTVGCSIEELEYYSLNKELNQLNAIETNGTISVGLGSELIKEMSSEIPQDMKVVQDILATGFDIKYTAKVSKKPLAYEVNIDFRKKGETAYKKVTTIIGNDKVVYVNLKDYLVFLKPYILAWKPSEEKVINALLAKVEYVQVDLNSDADMQEYAADLSNSDELVNILTGFTDLFKEAYIDYSSGTIMKKGNGYEFKLEAKDIKPLIIKFVEYTITNIDAIVEKVSTKVNSMSDKDFEYLAEAFNDSRMDKEELLSGLEDLRSKIKAITPEKLEEMKNQEPVDEIFVSIEGSVLRNYIEKGTDNTYKSTNDLIINYQNKMFLDIKENAQIKKLDAFSITKPSKSTTVEGLESIVASVLPPQVDTIKINLKTKKTTVTYSNKKTSSIKLTYYKVGEDTYASLTTINKVLGTQMSWDAKKQVALVKKDGKTIELGAKKINGYIYIKVADLEKIGYRVWTDAKTQEINIKNLNKQSIFQ